MFAISILLHSEISWRASSRVSLLTIVVQCLATGKLIKRFGAGPAAAFLPLVFGIGFLALWATPMLWVVIAFQAVQRAANFALSNPAREIHREPTQIHTPTRTPTQSTRSRRQRCRLTSRVGHLDFYECDGAQ